MAKYFHYFLPLSAISKDELEAVICLQEIPFELQANNEVYKLMIRVLGRPYTIDAITVTADKNVPIELREKHIKRIASYMISVLRLTYDASVDVIRKGDSSFIYLWMETDEPVPTYSVSIQQQINTNHIIDTHNITVVFCETLNSSVEPLLSLLAESQTPIIPLHYKILSLIRALEILFPIEKERFEYLDQYQEQFSKINVSTKLFRNSLPEIRAKCAHGISRGGAKPFVSQAYGELPKIDLLLGLLRNMVIEGLKEKHNFILEVKNAPVKV